MKNIYLTVIITALVMFCTPAYPDQPPEEILKAIFKIRSVVPVNARTARSLGTEREGNGVVIDSEGHVLTMGYLILEAEDTKLFGADGKPINSTFVGYDHKSGFGLLRASKPLGIRPIKMGQSSEIQVGDPVLVASYGGLESVQAARIVSRQEFAGQWEYLLEDAVFTVPVHANFGGAALIDRDGRLVGIGSLLTQVLIHGLGTIPSNMFVPIDELKPILGDLISRGRPHKPPRPWLGLYSDEAQGRVIVLRVSSGSPAEKAGVQPGDIILEVNKMAVKGLADFYRKVWSLGRAGIDVPLSILQGTRILDIIIQSADRSQYMRLQPKR